MSKTIAISFFMLLSASAAFTQSFEKNKVVDLLQSQQYEEAVNYLAPFSITEPENIQVLSYLGLANNLLEDNKAAETYFKRVLAIDSNNLAATQFLANVNNTDNAEQAITMTIKLIQLQPARASNYRNLGKLYKGKRQRDSALACFNIAYRMLPSDYKNAAALSEMMIESKNFKRADSIIGTSLLRDSNNIVLLRLSLKSAFEKKDYKTACTQGEKLMRLNDVSNIPLSNLAIAYFNLKLYNDCIRVCDYMLFNELDGETIYYYKAKCWAGLMNFPKSNELFQVCLDKAIPNNLELYFYNIGQNYEAMKQFDKAIANYDTAYYFSKDPVMNYNIALVYETGLKNLPLAKKYYQKFLTGSKPQTDEEKKVYAYVKERWWKK